jgi:hypothetical protein
VITRSRMLALLGGLGLLGFAPPETEPSRFDPVVPQWIRVVGRKATPGGGDVTSLQVQLVGTGVPAGRRLVARLATGKALGPVSASDSRGNTWTLDAEKSDDAQLVRAVVLSAHVSQPLAAGDIITVKFPAAANAALIVDEYAGVAPGAAVDKKASQSGQSATASSPAVTTTGPNQLLVGHVATRGKADQVNLLPGSGWTASANLRADTRWALSMHRVALAPGSFTASAGLGVSTGWAAVLVAYRPAEAPVRAAPTPAPEVVATTDLQIEVQNSSNQWVEELNIIDPVTLHFYWKRPAAELVRGTTTTSPRETPRAQWQMVPASSPATAVVFLPNSQVGPSGLPAWAFYSYDSVLVAKPGGSATFTIPPQRLPARSLSRTFFVRVVLAETSLRLRASPWVKISYPYLTAGVPGDPLSIVLSEIEVIHETDDASPEDEISAAVLSVDLTSGSYRLVYTGIYDFDQDDEQLDRKWPNLGVWGTAGTYPNAEPRPIAAADAAVVIPELIEHDGSLSVSEVQRAAVKGVIGPKVAELRASGLPNAEIIKQLRTAFRKALESFITEPSDSELFQEGWVSGDAITASKWDFTEDELKRARQGEMVEKVLTFSTTLADDIIPSAAGYVGDDSEYKVRFKMTRQDLSTR